MLAAEQILTLPNGQAAEDGRTLGDYNVKTLTMKIKNGHTTSISHTVLPTYTVTVPASVKMGETLTISAENVIPEKGKQLAVSLYAASGENNSFTLTTAEGATLNYSVTTALGQLMDVGSVVLTINPEVASGGSVQLHTHLEDNVEFAGEYTGTITFRISVADLPQQP